MFNSLMGGSSGASAVASATKPKSALAQALASGASNGMNKIASGSNAYFGFGTGHGLQQEPPFENTSGNQMRRMGSGDANDPEYQSFEIVSPPPPTTSLVGRMTEGIQRKFYLVLLIVVLIV